MIVEKNEGATPWPGSAPSEERGILPVPTSVSIASTKKDYNSDASNFLKYFAEEEQVTFQTFDDHKGRFDKSLIRVLHGRLEQHLQLLTELNQKGAGIFFTVNATDLHGRGTNNITKVRAFFVDLDGAPLDPVLSAPLRPQIVVQTSQGRFHAYWLVQEVSLDKFTTVQKVLIQQFGADPSVHDLPRVMRLPGFYHRKKEPFLVQVCQLQESPPYNFTEFLQAFSIDLTAVTKNSNVSQSDSDQDPILQALKQKGLVRRSVPGRSGIWEILCPNRDAHSTGDQGTVYIEAHTNGYKEAVFKCQHAHCAALSIDYLKEYLGLQEEWSDPLPLSQDLSAVASFQKEMLPDAIRPWLVDIAERMQVPLDFLVASCMVVLGALIGRKVGLYPKAFDDWLVVPNLWGAIVGRPSLLKSPAIAEIMKPIDELSFKAIDQHQLLEEKYEYEELLVQAKKAALKEKMKQAARKKNLSNEADQFEKIPSPIKPEPKRYKTEDCTVEKIGELLQSNPQGLLVHRDELVGWLKNCEKYGREGDRAFYLEAWNGTGAYTVDRIGRGTLHIPALCLSIIGGIQPGPLAQYVHQATSGGEGDDGLLQRFQLLVWPDVPKTWEKIDRIPDATAKEQAFGVFQKIDTFEPFGPSPPQGFKMYTLHFEAKAQVMFDDWRADLERRLRAGDLSPFLESHLAKYRSLMPKLALILYLVETVGRGVQPKAVDICSTVAAIRWCDYLETHARRMYSSAENPAEESARALLNHIIKGDLPDGFSFRDVYYAKHWARLETAEQVTSAIKLLEVLGWVKTELVKTKGRPTSRVRIHPSARANAQGFKEETNFSEGG